MKKQLYRVPFYGVAIVEAEGFGDAGMIVLTGVEEITIQGRGVVEVGTEEAELEVKG